MGKTRKEFEYLLENLSRAQSEDEVISYLKNMIKGFSSSFYQECILSNPYYKSLFLEIREDVLEDLDFVWRAKQLGYRCECVLDARFFHKKEVMIDWFI